MITSDPYNLIFSFWIILVLQILFFAFALKFKTDKLTDLSYSLSFIIASLFVFFKQKDLELTKMLLLSMVVLWGLRLGAYLFIRILKIKKDPRFDGIREDPLKFGAFWALQAISIFIILVPATIYLSASPVGIDLIFILGSLIWLAGLFIETIADYQKYKFKSNPKNKNKWIDYGLWRYSRHPNYFGEITLWWGLFIITIPIQNGLTWLSILGPLFITTLILFISGIPPLERNDDKNYGKNKKYKLYKKNTSILIPMPRKN